MNPAALARAAGVGIDYVRAVERGRLLPSRHALEKLAFGLDMPVEELIRASSADVPYSWPEH